MAKQPNQLNYTAHIKALKKSQTPYVENLVQYDPHGVCIEVIPGDKRMKPRYFHPHTGIQYSNGTVAEIDNDALTVGDIVNSPNFARQFDRVKMRFMNRPPARPGFKYKRTGYDQLHESGLLNLNSIIDNYFLIMSGVCQLSGAMRQAIKEIGGECYNVAFNEIVNKPIEEVA